MPHPPVITLLGMEKRGKDRGNAVSAFLSGCIQVLTITECISDWKVSPHVSLNPGQSSASQHSSLVHSVVSILNAGRKGGCRCPSWNSTLIDFQWSQIQWGFNGVWAQSDLNLAPDLLVIGDGRRQCCMPKTPLLSHLRTTADLGRLIGGWDTLTHSISYAHSGEVIRNSCVLNAVKFTFWGRGLFWETECYNYWRSVNYTIETIARCALVFRM